MISYLEGTILAHTKEGAIIKSGSVGYEVLGLWLGRKPLESPVAAWTYEYLENSSIPRLIGCSSLEERNLLIELMTVQGVGPKMAGRIVDACPADKLKTAIAQGDLDLLTSIKGLGKKTAQKIILELGKTLVDTSVSAHQFIYDALTDLKFTRGEIDRAIAATDLSGLSESGSLGAVLKTLGRKS